MHGYLTYRRKAKERGLPIMSKSEWTDFWKVRLAQPNIKRARRAYNHQMMAASKRQIDWYFNIEEWLHWWETNLGPDWISKRGCRTGQYVMARFEDSGEYSVDNVKCILATDNSSEGFRRVGNAHHMRKHLSPHFKL